MNIPKNAKFSSEWAKTEYASLSRWQRFKLLSGWCSIPIREELRPGWTGEIMIYLVWCPKHRLIYDVHPHGYQGRLPCPECAKEDFGRISDAAEAARRMKQ